VQRQASAWGIATAFAQAGAKVMLCDIEEAALSAAVEQLRRTNADCRRRESRRFLQSRTAMVKLYGHNRSPKIKHVRWQMVQHSSM